MNVLTLRNRARRKSGINASDYSNAELLEDFNIGYYSLAELLALLGEDYFEEQRTRFSLIANSGLYNLPTDFMALKRVLIAYSGTPVSLSAYTIANSWGTEDTHDLSFEEVNVPISNPIYDLMSSYIRYSPKPSAAVTNGGVMDYIAMPSALVNTGDTPVVPIQYHEKLAVYGAMQMAFKYEKWNKHARLQKEWDATISELQNRLAERDANKPVRFKTPHEGMRTGTRVREL